MTLTTPTPIIAVAIAGLRLRYDVPTKCTVVQDILTRKFADKEDVNTYITGIATRYKVNPATIKVWCAKYASTYSIGMTLPTGTMAFVATPITGPEIAVVDKQLTTIRNNFIALKLKYHPDTKRTPSEVLDELVSDKRGV
jgi:hypothetical protein